jgi:virulence factor Mce-like protein
VSAPLRRGAALARQRLAGLVFLVVIALLLALSVAVYDRRFADVVEVGLRTDRIGNQLTVNGDVKVRGLIVGRITDVDSTGDGATITMAIDRDKAALVPRTSVGRLLPKTLFGEKFVALVPPPAGAAAAPGVREGDELQQDRSARAIETAEVLDDLLPLLTALDPEGLSATLSALSGALRGRGDEIGDTLVRSRDYLAALNPALPTLQKDLQGLADLADALDDAAPDLLAVLDDLSFSSRSVQDQSDALSRFLTTTTAFAGSGDALLRQNEQRLVRVASDSRAPLALYEDYAAGYGCFLRALDALEPIIGRSFGGAQPGLRITLEVTADQGGFLPTDTPLNADTTGPSCYGLDPRLKDDITVYREAADGYNDDLEQATPGVQTGRTGEAAQPNDLDGTPPSGPVSARSTGAVKVVSAPVLGTTPDRVPDLAELMLGPLVRGTTVRYAADE